MSDLHVPETHQVDARLLIRLEGQFVSDDPEALITHDEQLVMEVFVSTIRSMDLNKIVADMVAKVMESMHHQAHHE